jgi:hypothetical protein
MKRCVLLLLALAACDEWLPSLPALPFAGLDAGVDAGAPTTVHATKGADGWLGTIDATAKDPDSGTAIFTGVDLDTGLEAALDQGAWDLAFGRSNIRSNSGWDGDGGVRTAVLRDAGLATITRAPATGYVVDLPPVVDGGEPVTPFDDRAGWAWYDYDGELHTLSPKKATWVVNSTTGRYYALELLSYYDGFGVGGLYSVHWVEVPAP